MYCSTCGAYQEEGTSACEECGSALAATAGAVRPLDEASGPGGRYGAEDGRWISFRRVGTCPRCGYRGQGISYFSKGTHAAALIGITILTAGAMGVGGLVYYLIRREHRVCPRCGLGWGRHGEVSHAPAVRAAAPTQWVRVPPASRERSRRTLSVLLFLLAGILAIIGVSGSMLPPLLVAAASATGGYILHRSANVERERRRHALIAELQLPVLRLARQAGGRLTVTQVASSLGWTMARAEKILNSLEDGLRVNSEVTDDGVIVYEFLEILHARDALRPGEDAPERRLEGGA